MMIDRMRMLNDPVNSYYRLEKDFPRTVKLQASYPFETTKQKPKMGPPNADTTSLIKIVFDSFKDSKSIVVMGYYAYYTMLGIKPKDILNKIPYLDIVSGDFRIDTYKILALLKTSYKDATKITITEYYPFFQFYGHHATIFVEGKAIVNVYHNNNMCIPYQKVKVDGATIQLATFIYTLMEFLIAQFRMRVEKNKPMGEEYEVLFSSLLEYRNDYLKKNKKSVFDDTLFKEFIIECAGKTVPPDRLFRLQIEKKIQSKKGPYTLRYDPQKETNFDPTVYKFANTSGNSITNPKNLKIDISKIDSYETLDKPSL
jgi:hypothetical protein